METKTEKVVELPPFFHFYFPERGKMVIFTKIILDMAIRITKDEEQLAELGIESLTVGHSFETMKLKSCTVKIICELKVVNDKKFKGGYKISFAVIDDKGSFVGAAQEWINDRKAYLKAGLFTLDYVECSTNAKNIREIKVYAMKR